MTLAFIMENETMLQSDSANNLPTDRFASLIAERLALNEQIGREGNDEIVAALLDRSHAVDIEIAETTSKSAEGALLGMHLLRHELETAGFGDDDSTTASRLCFRIIDNAITALSPPPQ